MLPIETLIKDLNVALNGILADKTRVFDISPDGGEYVGYTRKYNDITQYIEGVASITDSGITPLSGIEVATQTLSVTVAVKLDPQKGVKDEDIFLPVRNAIAAYASQTYRNAYTENKGTENEKTYSVAFTATQPYAGELAIRPEIGRSIIYTFSVFYSFVQNGVNSKEITLTFEGETVPFEELTIVRVPVQDGGAFSSSGGAAKNITTQTALELNFSTPALTNNAISQELNAFILTGAEKAFAVTIKTPYAENATAYTMSFGQSSVTARGTENCGFSTSLVECFVGGVAGGGGSDSGSGSGSGGSGSGDSGSSGGGTAPIDPDNPYNPNPPIYT